MVADGSAIEITFTDDDRAYKIIHANGTIADKNFTADFAGYEPVLDTLGGTALTEDTAIGAYQTIIAYKGI